MLPPGREKPRSHRLIVDQFTDLNISHQRKTQLRCELHGLCIHCGKPRAEGERYCLDKLIGDLKRQREYAKDGTWQRAKKRQAIRESLGLTRPYSKRRTLEELNSKIIPPVL